VSAGKVDVLAVELRRIPRGGTFRLAPDGPTYVRGTYDRSDRTFRALLIEQHTHHYLQVDALVYAAGGAK
jgi:hypothetical protein